MNKRSRTMGPVLWSAGVIVAVVLITGGVIGSFNPGPRQPVPFSHHVHAGTKKMSCFFCHPYAVNSSNAGIPPMAKCMLCHKEIASNFAPIAEVRGYYERNEGIPWVRVATVPDHVHFSHEAHLVKGVDCGECHGDVRSMDRVRQVRDFDMAFCVDCHKERDVTRNCVLCHY